MHEKQYFLSKRIQIRRCLITKEPEGKGKSSKNVKSVQRDGQKRKLNFHARQASCRETGRFKKIPSSRKEVREPIQSNGTMEGVSGFMTEMNLAVSIFYFTYHHDHHRRDEMIITCKMVLIKACCTQDCTRHGTKRHAPVSPR